MTLEAHLGIYAVSIWHGALALLLKFGCQSNLELVGQHCMNCYQHHLHQQVLCAQGRPLQAVAMSELMMSHWMM